MQQRFSAFANSAEEGRDVSKETEHSNPRTHTHIHLLIWLLLSRMNNTHLPISQADLETPQSAFGAAISEWDHSMMASL
jgi:hypothetical protein